MNFFAKDDRKANFDNSYARKTFSDFCPETVRGAVAPLPPPPHDATPAKNNVDLCQVLPAFSIYALQMCIKNNTYMFEFINDLISERNILEFT